MKKSSRPFGNVSPAKAKDALELTRSYMDEIPVALALFSAEREMRYCNRAMKLFLLVHDLAGYDAGFLDRIAGAGDFGDSTLDPRAEAVFDPAVPRPEPFTTDIALLGNDGGSNYTLTLKRLDNKPRRTGKRSGCSRSAAKRNGWPWVILLLNDVTQLTRAKIDAEAASRAKSAFLSRVSHEIRTPLNAVTGMTRIAKNSTDIKKIRGCLDRADDAANRLLGLINDILDFSKIESGKLSLDIAEFSLSENLESAAAVTRRKALERNIAVRLSLENIRNDLVSTDARKLNQVLLNLLSNAVKFSPDGSEVLVNVRELGHEGGFSSYSLEVTDHGIGISEYHASLLFSPFEQADGGLTRDYGGAGLGLAISGRLAEMLGGKITLASGEGKGSVFTFTVNCASRPKTEKVEEKAAGQNAAVFGGGLDFSGKRCLLVDDIDINREIIAEFLAVTNLVPEMAENGREAVEKFESSGAGYFDIIIMDIQMPVMDGCTAAREIRRIEEKRAGKKTPIIALTANITPEDIQRALDSGMNAYLSKPVEPEAALRTISEQLRKDFRANTEINFVRNNSF